MKHRYFLTNMIVNKYIVKKDDIDKFKDILQSYYDEHEKNLMNLLYRLFGRKMI